MTVAEQRTIKMIDSLPFASLKKVQSHLNHLFESQTSEIKMKPVSEKEFLARVDRAEEDIVSDRVSSWPAVRERTRAKYGL